MMDPIQEYDVFICYRREGGEYVSLVVRNALAERGYRIFYDIESLRSGAFNKRLFDVIDQCTDVLVILTKGSLDRTANENDWVRKEIAHALKRGKNVVPIMTRDFVFPNTLPEDINELRYHNGPNLNLDFFDPFMDKLASRFLLSTPVTVSDPQAATPAPADTPPKPSPKRIRWSILLPAAVLCLVAAFLIYRLLSGGGWPFPPVPTPTPAIVETAAPTVAPTAVSEATAAVPSTAKIPYEERRIIEAVALNADKVLEARSQYTYAMDVLQLYLVNRESFSIEIGEEKRTGAISALSTAYAKCKTETPNPLAPDYTEWLAQQERLSDGFDTQLHLLQGILDEWRAQLKVAEYALKNQKSFDMDLLCTFAYAALDAGRMYEHALYDVYGIGLHGISTKEHTLAVLADYWAPYMDCEKRLSLVDGRWQENPALLENRMRTETKVDALEDHFAALLQPGKVTDWNSLWDRLYAAYAAKEAAAADALVQAIINRDSSAYEYMSSLLSFFGCSNGSFPASCMVWQIENPEASTFQIGDILLAIDGEALSSNELFKAMRNGERSVQMFRNNEEGGEIMDMTVNFDEDGVRFTFFNTLATLP